MHTASGSAILSHPGRLSYIFWSSLIDTLGASMVKFTGSLASITILDMERRMRDQVAAYVTQGGKGNLAADAPMNTDRSTIYLR